MVIITKTPHENSYNPAANIFDGVSNCNTSRKRTWDQIYLERHKGFDLNKELAAMQPQNNHLAMLPSVPSYEKLENDKQESSLAFCSKWGLNSQQQTPKETHYPCEPRRPIR